MEIEMTANQDSTATTKTGAADTALIQAACNHLFDALTLLHAASASMEGEPKSDEFTSADSRTTALIWMADAKVKSALGPLMNLQ
jgi:hypothetical protein